MAESVGVAPQLADPEAEECKMCADEPGPSGCHGESGSRTVYFEYSTKIGLAPAAFHCTPHVTDSVEGVRVYTQSIDSIT